MEVVKPVVTRQGRQYRAGSRTEYILISDILTMICTGQHTVLVLVTVLTVISGRSD